MPDYDFPLIMTDDAAQKLAWIHMSAQDALTVIKHAEMTGNYVTQPSSGHRFAHLRIGSITLWADYRPLHDGTFILESVWSHRIQIVEGL